MSTMSEPTVDVIIATNRDSPYLHDAIESVRAQSWTGWRLTLVDDGSPAPDFLRRAVVDVPGARVLRQAPSGLPAARNTGIRSTEGGLITFLDDDDVWHHDRLHAQVAAWRSAPHHVAVYSAGWYMGPDGARFGVGWPAVQTQSARFLSGEVPPPRIVTLMVRRDVCESMGGFDETFSLAEDNEFILRLAQQGELLAVPTPLVGYRRHASNMSGEDMALAGRRANERLLELHIAEAVRRGDSTTALLLRRNLRNLRRRCASDSVRHMAAAARRADGRGVLQEAAWAARRAPLRTLGVLTAKAATSLRPSRRPRQR
jgi:glycosyltransferase involved in cell wall biosynthesis